MPSPSLTPNEARASFLELARIEVRARRAREMADDTTRDFRRFMRESWHVVEPAKPYLDNWHMDAMAEHAQAVADGQIHKLAVSVPPGVAKSIVWSVQFPAWMWTPKRNPGWRSTFASYAATLAERDSVRCRNLLQSVWFRETFQPDWRFATDQNVKSYFVNSAMGHRFSTSVGAVATGFRGDGIFIDDCIKAGDRNSDAALSAVIDWWQNEMFNRLNDFSTGAKVIIMQRLSERDLIGHVLREGGYENLCIPMEYDPSRSKVTSIGWKDPRTEKGELMFPALFPREVVDNELKTDAARWGAQYQQQPVSDTGAILKPYLWQYWQPAGLNLPPVRVRMPDGSIDDRRAVALPDSFDQELLSFDCTFKGTNDSDYVAGLAVSVRGAQRFLRDTEHARMSLPETINAVRRLAARTPGAHLKLVEDKANGPAVIQMLEQEVAGLWPVNPGADNKVSRAAAASVMLTAGNWFLPHPLIAPWVGNPENPTESGFLAETSVFPFGDHDDWVDAWSQAENEIRRGNAGGIFGVSEKDIRAAVPAIDDRYPRLWGMSTNWHETGVVWLARTPDTGAHYLYAEFRALNNDPAQHAKGILERGDWIPGVMHGVTKGRDQKDGYALVAKYQKLGLKLQSVDDALTAEIADVTEALKSGKLKVSPELHDFWTQLRMFRRNEKGDLPDKNSAIIQAMCVAWKHRDKMRVKPAPAAPRQTVFSSGPPSGTAWMGS